MPGKNIKPLAGKPLIAYSIEAAHESRLLERVIVSTDDTEIAAVANAWGVTTPFMRPPELATDEVLIYPVLIHALQWLDEHEKYRSDYVLLLQPTSPLRIGEDIDNAIRIARDKDADGVVSVCESAHHPYWTKKLADDGHLIDAFPQDATIPRRQELPAFYTLNGAIYLVRSDVLLTQSTFYTDKTFPYIMPPNRSIDIDSEWHFKQAEMILTAVRDAGDN